MKCRTGFILAVGFLALLPAPRETDSCTVCHSKNPKMVRMHEALQYSNCFQCHGPGKSRTADEQKTQMAANPLCTGCHRTN